MRIFSILKGFYEKRDNNISRGDQMNVLIKPINKDFLKKLRITKDIEKLKTYLNEFAKDRIPGYYDNSFKLALKNRKYMSILLVIQFTIQ